MAKHEYNHTYIVIEPDELPEMREFNSADSETKAKALWALTGATDGFLENIENLPPRGWELASHSIFPFGASLIVSFVLRRSV